MTLYDFTVPTFIQMLGALAGQLDKGARMAESGDALMEARLAPDMYPLSSQVRFTCIQAIQTIGRLTGRDMPLPDEAQTGFEQCKGHIATTIAMLEGIGPDDLAVDEGTIIELALPNGMTFDLSRSAYVRDWALPQFYFHLVAAYSILRHKGAEIGKVDYVPYMLAYMRK